MLGVLYNGNNKRATIGVIGCTATIVVNTRINLINLVSFVNKLNREDRNWARINNWSQCPYVVAEVVFLYCSRSNAQLSGLAALTSYQNAELKLVRTLPSGTLPSFGPTDFFCADISRATSSGLLWQCALLLCNIPQSCLVHRT